MSELLQWLWSRPQTDIVLVIIRTVFDTKSREVIDVYLGMFNCLPAQQVIALSKRKFLRKFSATDNLLCRACTDNAVKEIASLSSVGS